MNAAKDAGFTVSIDDNSVISGDTAAIQAANENKDGDILFGLNETRWSQVVNGTYENLSLVDWTPTWAEQVGQYAYPGAAYGLVIQNVLMLYRTDELGTDGEALHFQHWSDIVNCGYKWYRQNKVGGTTNANINSALLYSFVDSTSPAGGISIDGWKTLWNYCATACTPPMIPTSTASILPEQGRCGCLHLLLLLPVRQDRRRCRELRESSEGHHDPRELESGGDR